MKISASNKFSLATHFLAAGSALAGLLLGGCASTAQSRIDADPQTYAQATAAQRTLIERGEASVQMTPQMVRMALGNPSQITEQPVGDHVEIVWRYLETPGSDAYKAATSSISGAVESGPTGTPLPAGVSTPPPVVERYRITFRDDRVIDVKRPVQ